MPAVVSTSFDEIFARLMEPLGPFETAPALAVAVSGGADSLALCLLADHWARARGGRAVGLTVDHGLRPESRDEARRVGENLASFGIAHHILTWVGGKPATGIQAAARQARYRLLEDWCGKAGLLHLLLAHHADDQAETLLMRLARGSGLDGLSSMAPVSVVASVRLLRPLLSLSHADLCGYLRGRGISWVEDPSNGNRRFERVRWRQMTPDLASAGMSVDALGMAAARCARARIALDSACDDLAARAVTLRPGGFAEIGRAAFEVAPAEIGLRLLGRVLAVIGGGQPRLERLERLLATIGTKEERRVSMAGAVVSPRKRSLLVHREAGRIGEPVPVSAGQRIWWDGRFEIVLGGAGQGWIGALGGAGWRKLRPVIGKPPASPAVIATFPTLCDEHGISQVPHLGYNRQGAATVRVERICFAPANGLSRP